MVRVGVRAHCCFVHEGDFVRIALNVPLRGWQLNPNLEVSQFVSILPSNVRASTRVLVFLILLEMVLEWLMEADVAYFLWSVVKHGVLNWRSSKIKTLDFKYTPMIIIYKEEEKMKLLKDWNVGLGVTSTLLKSNGFCCYSFKFFFFFWLKIKKPMLGNYAKTTKKEEKVETLS